MSKGEIEDYFGKEITERVRILNHEWKNKTNLINIGSTPSIPIVANKIAYEADYYLIGVGISSPTGLLDTETELK